MSACVVILLTYMKLIGVQHPWSNSIRNKVQYFLPLVLLLLYAFLLTAVSLLCVVLLSRVYFYYLTCTLSN